MFELIQKLNDPKLNKNSFLNEYKLPDHDKSIFIREKSMDFMIMTEVFLHKCYDVDLERSYYFRNYKKNYHVRTPEFIIDAGAHIGLTSIFYAQKYPQAKILSIEPDTENYYLLLKNTSSYPNITPLLGALWNKSTSLYINNRFQLGKDGYLKSAEYELTENKILHEPQVRAYTLNELIQDYKIDFIDVLKVDIEGAEKNVFKDDYEKWLSKTKVLLLESHDHKHPLSFKAVMAALSNYDFLYLPDNTELKSVLMFLLI